MALPWEGGTFHGGVALSTRGGTFHGRWHISWGVVHFIRGVTFHGGGAFHKGWHISWGVVHFMGGGIMSCIMYM